MDQINSFSSNEPTPPLDLNPRDIFNQPAEHPDIGFEQPSNIAPARVLQKRFLSQADILFSPVYNVHESPNYDKLQQDQAQPETGPTLPGGPNNLFDLIEPGSGSGWDPKPLDETLLREDDATMTNDFQSSPSFVVPTPVMNVGDEHYATPMIGDGSNSPPLLTRRIPRLVATAGLKWHYTIKPDSFIDEDGDLRQLRSSLATKDSSDNSLEKGKNIDPFHWLQYDQNTQTLYGYPTEDDAGKHDYILMVSDQFGRTSYERLEIIVRQHQSTLAFTHSFKINRISWSQQKYPTIVVALADLVKRICSRVFADSNVSNLILKSYRVSQPVDLTKPNQTDQIYTLTIEWSNISMPIYPCDMGKIETTSRKLVDVPSIGWSLEYGQRSDLMPSQLLVGALMPDFRPDSVEISLQGACEGKTNDPNSNVQASSDNVNNDPQEPHVKSRIGKLNWKLGQPILYEIPDQVFQSDNGSRNTRNLSLALHTIDGLTLDSDVRYNFLEFNPENRTIFGLPYDLTKHSGQRELILTARHPITNHKAQEVFVINIEPQALTILNNRAFRMSLYFMARTVRFGPQERVAISQRISEAIGSAGPDFKNEQEISQFTIVDLQKFSFSLYAQNSILYNSQSGSWKYLDNLARVDDSFATTEAHPATETFPSGDEGVGEKSFLYKLTWTNESIGYDGNCPVEVIKDEVLDALERSMIDFVPSLGENKFNEDLANKNDSVRFYERLRAFFEPEVDLIHLRFEPLGDCINALELHDAGNGDIADQIDRAGDDSFEYQTEATRVTPPIKIEEQPKNFYNNDEYWSIVVLIILVVVLIFVVMMFFLGMHTYKINQEKKFELQVKMAQARQNSMYLSSMMLADQGGFNDFSGQMLAANMAKPLYATHNEDRSSRKPVILDNEKQLWANGHMASPMFKQTATHLNGQAVQTIPLRPNMTFTLDSIASAMQNGTVNMIQAGIPNYVDSERQRSMTLNRRSSGASQQSRLMQRQASMNQLNHSQSILTVASLAGPIQVLPHHQTIYGPLPVVCESVAEMP